MLFSYLRSSRTTRQIVPHQIVPHHAPDRPAPRAKNTEHGNYDYDYDELYRLTTVTGTEFNSVPPDENYTYDKVGNRLKAKDVIADFVYNENNELQDASDVNLTFGYDVNGNTVKRMDGAGGAINTCDYDTDNRMVEVKDGSDAVIATYSYDPFGRRLWKEVAGGRIYYLYADEGLVGEYLWDGNQVVEGKTHGWLPNATWGTDPLFMKEGGAYYWYLNDHLGTPQKMVNGSGAVVWSAEYGAFGMAGVTVETVVSNLRFPGQYYDEETGLHYNWHRYYDPSTGRYITADPIGLAGGINLFSYVQGNPVNLTDPMGLSTYTCERPIDGKPGEAVSLLEKFVWYYHEYNCITLPGSSDKICDSSSASSQWPGGVSPGVPSEPDVDYYDSEACKEIDDSKDYCVERCLQMFWQQPRPDYDTPGPYGTDCQEYSEDTLAICLRGCK